MRFIKEVTMMSLLTVLHCVAVIVLYVLMDRRVKEIEKRVYPCREEENCCIRDKKDV